MFVPEVEDIEETKGDSFEEEDEEGNREGKRAEEEGTSRPAMTAKENERERV